MADFLDFYITVRFFCDAPKCSYERRKKCMSVRHVFSKEYTSFFRRFSKNIPPQKRGFTVEPTMTCHESRQKTEKSPLPSLLTLQLLFE